MPAEALRGPRPPALVCRDCDRTIRAEFANPILEAKKKLGVYQGETTGGLGACNRCLAKRDERIAALTKPKARVVVDVPERERESRLANFTRRPGVKAALDAAADWLEARDRDLYLYGPTGTGKTRLAVSLLNECNARGLVGGELIYVRVPTLIERLKASFGQDVPAHAGKLETYLYAGLLVLDDLGAEHGTSYTRTTVETLYNDRLDAGRPTILTSNLPLGLSLEDQMKPEADRTYRIGLGDFLGDDRMVSRIAGNAEIVEMAGDDQRLDGWKRRRRHPNA